jgi:hypothetical protein
MDNILSGALMGLFRRVAVFIFAMSLTGVAAYADNTIPRYFDFKFGGDPLWIAASEAITPAGVLRSDIQRPGHLKHQIARWHERQAAAGAATSQATPSPQSCDISFAEKFTEGPDEGAITSREVLEEMVSSRLVIDGSVSALDVGIHDGMPYTIIQIDVNSKQDPKRVYLLYPKGRLRFDGLTFCNDDPAFADTPAVGDPIMFIASYPLDSTGTLFSTSWVVYEHQASVAASRRLRLAPADAPRSVKGFAEDLRATRQRRERQR